VLVAGTPRSAFEVSLHSFHLTLVLTLRIAIAHQTN
jgi:hypothetical protein